MNRSPFSSFLVAVLASVVTPSTMPPSHAPTGEVVVTRIEHPGPADTPPTVAREFRGAWVSPLDDMTGADWPSRPGLSPENQRAELDILLDHAKAIGLNAIVLHVRTAGDALYPSHLVPWSAFLSGKSGVGPKPEYDPLAFAVAEAHARGLQLHAWFNPFRALMPHSTARMAPNHVTRAHKAWIRKYGGQTWIDPGEPAARAAVLNEILDVVDRYDIDGVHLDDYFYPYRESRTVIRRVNGHRVRSREDIPFPDQTTWAKYGEKRFRTREDWRRANIDSFVSQLYAGVKKRKPWVLVGISPFGIWRSGEPPAVTGLSAYNELFADARLWLQQGWVDYLAPQLYWPIEGPEGRFSALDDWWRAQNDKHRAVWPGLFDAQVALRREGWPADEIPLQIERLRFTRTTNGESNGHIHFRLGALLMNGSAIGEILRRESYADPALIPAAPWLGGAPPADPVIVAQGSALQVSAGDKVPVAWWMIQALTSDGHWRFFLRRSTQSRIELSSLGDLGGQRVAITAVDRVGQLSQPVVLEVQ